MRANSIESNGAAPDRRSSFARPLGVLLALAFGLACIALPTTASAQDDGEKAKKYYKKGMQHFYKKDYPMAITNFKRANSISPSATLSYNISIAYSRMGNPKEALTYSREAKERGGLPKDTEAKNDGRIAAYGLAIKARQMTAQDDDSGDSGTSGGQASNQNNNNANAGGANGGGSGAAPPPSGGSDNQTLRWVGLSVGTVGLGLIGGSLAVSSNVSGKIDEKQTAEINGNLQEAETLHSDIQSQQTLGQILLYSGAAATVAGTAMFLIDVSSGSSDRRAVNVTAGPSRDGFRVGVDVDF